MVWGSVKLALACAIGLGRSRLVKSTPCVIGVDIGTSSTKAVLFDATGQEISQHAIGYRLYTPTPGTAEQDPEEIFLAVVQTVSQVVSQAAQHGQSPQQIGCVSFSAALHSLMAIAADGTLLTRSITWADNRSAPWADEIKRSPAGHCLYRRTGTPIHPMSPLAKIVWLRHEQPDLFKKTAKFISIKEYVFYRLTQQFWVDYSIASGTGLWNMATLDWDTEALHVAGIRANQLSQLVATTQVLTVPPTVTAAMGLLPDTPFVIGANDGVLANLGLGAIAPGVAALTIGTSGAIRAIVNHPITDPQERLFCYALTETHWAVGGAVNNGGIILQWLRDQLGLAATYEALLAMAGTVPPGADGLLFHPYLLGERSPLWQADARGSFFGLTLRHTNAHLVRAVLEGVTLNLFLILQAVQEVAGTISSLRAAGGFAQSSLWRQMIADVFNRPITIPNQRQSSSVGAAILGLYALQYIPSLEDNPFGLSETGCYQPNPAQAAIYQRILPVYNHLLTTVQPTYSLMAQLQRDLQSEV